MSNDMDIKNYYTFGSKLVSTTFMACPIGIGSQDDGKLLLGEYSGINFPVTFKQEDGKKLRDVLDTGTAILYLISDKMKALLEQNELTGWKTFPAKVYDKKGNEVKGYHGFSITGRCGTIDYDKSEIIEKIEGSSVSKYYRGLYVGLDDWDGSDFFMPKGFFTTIITKRAMQIMKEAKLTNIEFENLSEIERLDIIVSLHKEGM